MMVFMHLTSPLFLPLAVVMATTNWLSYLTSYKVDWPAEVLDKVGPRIDVPRKDKTKDKSKK